MKVLITGAAGYIGSNLAINLREKGLSPFGIDAFNDYYSPTIKRANAKSLKTAGIDVFECNLATDDLNSIVAQADAIVHLAAQPGISATTPWEDYHENNIIATHRLLEAAKQNDSLKLFANVATSSVYGLHATDTEEKPPKPASWYGATKLAAEQEALAMQRSMGLPACSLRLFSVYGPRERPEKLFPKLIKAIANDTEFPLYGNAREHQRSFTYVGDICDAILATLRNKERVIGEILNIGTDLCFTTGEAIETVEAVMGKKAKINHIEARPGDQKATHANIEKARRLLEWEPKTDLKTGVEKTVAWYMKEVHGKIDWKE